MFEADSHSIEIGLNISEKEDGDEHGKTVVPVGNFGEPIPVDTFQKHNVVGSSTDWRDSVSDAALEIPGTAAGVKCRSGMVVEAGEGRNEELVRWEQRVCIKQDADERRFESEQAEKDLELNRRLVDLRLTMEDEHRKLNVDLANKDRELEKVRLELRTLEQEYKQSSLSSSELVVI